MNPAMPFQAGDFSVGRRASVDHSKVDLASQFPLTDQAL
jgi:hypothetical protein